MSTFASESTDLGSPARVSAVGIFGDFYNLSELPQSGLMVGKAPQGAAVTIVAAAPATTRPKACFIC